MALNDTVFRSTPGCFISSYVLKTFLARLAMAKPLGMVV